MNGFLKLLCASILAIGQWSVCAEEKLLGEGNDGNRSKPVHLFELYDDAGMQIRAADTNPKPFSMKQTCGKCHDYEKISSGWHFNSLDPNVAPGRPGQPWVLTDSKTRTQIPLSSRRWPGTYAPEDVGMNAWNFLKTFYSQFPGGSFGELPVDEPDVLTRKSISGCNGFDILVFIHCCPIGRPEKFIRTDLSIRPLHQDRRVNVRLANLNIMHTV